MVSTKCGWCDKEIKRHSSKIKPNNFCSRECLGKFNSKEHNPDGYKYRDFSKNSERISELNKRVNLMRMTPNTRKKLRESHLGKGEGKSYTKIYGRHEHREVAEQMLGRPLEAGEVVHHINHNRRDNRPENLQVFKSQSDHAKWHAEKEVMPT